jgi:translocation and assembly module TamB
LKPEARGRLHARGNVRGDLHQPTLHLDATGSDIVWDEVAMQSLSAKVALDPQDSGRADVEVQISNLKIAKREAQSVRLHSAGTVAAHNVTVEIKAPQLQLHAAGDASLNQGLWRWQVAQLRAEDGHDLLLNLEAPAVFEMAADRLSLEQFCLRGERARLCGYGSSRAGVRTVKVSAESMPLRALTAGLAATTDFDGTLNIEAHAEATPASAWRGNLSAELVSAGVRHHFADGRVESFDLGTGHVGVDLSDAHLVATVELDAGKSGHVSGKASATGTDNDWHQWPLSGQLQLQSDALSLIDSYITEIDRASGNIDADLTLGGTASALQFGGTLKVTNARIDAYQINLALHDVNFDARLNDSVLTLSGSASAGVDGKANFNGDLRWREGQPYGQLHLQGDNLLIVNIPEAKVYAAPNVDMKIAGRRIDISGSVELPYARLDEPEQLATAVRASSDEVIVNAAVAGAREPFHVFSNVALKLGDRVTINTSGLQGRLSGTLTAVTDESGFSRGSGELNVEEGKYTAYGRKLDITRGRLIFSNSPLGDPGVDLRATKKFPDVIAGVNVRGTLSAPRMTFFSEPEVTQSQIVSLLLAGGSLERVQSSNSMVLQGSALLAQQFGNRIGADVSVESNLQNDTSLVLGRYLSPRLYLSYGISIAEAINTIKLNYTIGDKWTIRTEAGQNRSADLVYTLQR